MWLWPLIEAHEIAYSVLRQLGYEDRKADEAAGWIMLLVLLAGIWAGIEIFIYMDQMAH